MSASGTCIVTPGHTFGAGVVTTSDLNAAAAPSVVVGPKSVGAAHIVQSELLEMIGSGASSYNYLDNPGFSEDRWALGTTTSAVANTKTYLASAWWVLASGAAVTYARSATSPNTTTVHSASITGATSATTVLFGQDIPRRVSSGLADKLTITFWVYNGTGSALSPVVLLKTCDSVDNFSATTLRATLTPNEPGAVGVWTQYTLTTDASGLTNIANGLQFVIQFASGTLDSASKSVRIAQVKLEINANGESTPFICERERSADAQFNSANTGDASLQAAISANTGVLNALARVIPDNFLVNGFMDGNRFRFPETAGLTCTDRYNVNAAGWWIMISGTQNAVATRSTNVPSTGNGATGYAAHSLRITGASSLSAAYIGQDLTPGVTARATGQLTFSCWVRANSSTSPAPSLLIDTCGAVGDFSTTLNRYNSAATTSISANTWTRLSWTFSTSAITNWANGGRLYLSLAAGSLDSNTEWFEITECELVTGASAGTAPPEIVFAPQAAPVGTARVLITQNSSTTGATITARDLVLGNVETGETIIVDVTATAAFASSGANGLDTGSASDSTWYYLWAISNGVSHAALLSLQPAQPTMPAGYRYRALVGEVRRAAAGAGVVPFFGNGKQVFISAPDIAYTSGTSYASVALSTAVPPTAIFASGALVASGSAGSAYLSVAIAADSSGTHENFVGMTGSGVATGSYQTGGAFSVPLVTAQTLYAYSGTGSKSYVFKVRSYIRA